MLTAPPVTGRQVAGRQRVLAVAAAGAGLAFIDATIVNVAFPDILRSFGDSSVSDVSWVLNAYNIVFAAFLVAAGRIADLLGRKRLFELGIVVFTVASLLCAIAPSLGFLVFARVLQAIGAAIVVPASLAIVMQAFPGRERTHGVALWSATAALAAGLGPSLGGVLVEIADWRLVFLVNLPLGAIALVASKRTLVESRAPGRRTIPDLPGALLLAVATASLTFGIIKGEEWGWGDARVLGSFAAALVVGALFVTRCRWHHAPMLDLGLLRIRSLATANLLTLVGAAGFYSYVLANVLFLTAVWGYSVLEAGLALTPGPFVAAAVAGPAGKLAERIGHRFVLAIGGAVWTGGVLFLIERVGTQPAFISEWLPAMVLLGLGAGLTFPIVGSAAVAAVSGGRFATATGLNSIARQLGAVLGVALLVAIVGTPTPAEAAGAFDRGWTLAAVCFAIVAVGGLAIGHIERPGEDADEPVAPLRTPPAVAPPPVPASATPATVPATPPQERTTVDRLRAVAMFAELGDAALADVAGRVERVRLEAGQWLFRQGDPAGSVFIVASGRLEVILDEDGREELLRVMGPGAVAGELALLAASTRSASVRARRDSELLELTRAEFERLMHENERFSAELVRLLGTQLQRSRALAPAAGGAGAETIALVASSDGVAIEQIADVLTRELGAAGPTVRCHEAVNGDLATHAALLNRYEDDHDHIVLVARRRDDEWGRFCLRQADRVVLAAEPGPVPDWVAQSAELRGCDLLYEVGRGGVESMREWIDALHTRTWHVIEEGDRREASLARAGRRLAGRAVGLVLSGGGARALAHIGVLEELWAAGIQIDRVGGCSMGAVIGAMVALGMDPEAIDARCYEDWVKGSPLSDYRLPRTSILRGKRVAGVLERCLPGEVEETPLSYFAVAGDLEKGDLVVLRRGRLFHAAGASASIPGLLPPTPIGGRLLVDGGVLNNLPVDVMASSHEGPVIAVDVTAQFTLPAARDNGRGPGRAYVHPLDGETALPPLSETLLRGLLLGSADTSEAARRHADLVIAPPDEGVGLLEFHQLDVLRESGRRAAAAALEHAPASVLG